MNLLLLEPEELCDVEGAADGVQRARVVLRGRRLRHLRLVHRAEAGRELRAGVVGGAVGRALVEAIDEEQATLRVELDAAPPAKLALTLLIALPRPKTLRRVLQAAATLGVARLVLTNSWRVEKSYWKSPALEAAALRAELLLGLEQGGDTVLPEVTLERLLVPFVRERLDGLAAGSTRLIAHPGTAAECPRAPAGAITLALGPERGFLDREIALFEAHGFAAVSLGPRPLRVEQAVAALVGRLT